MVTKEANIRVDVMGAEVASSTSAIISAFIRNNSVARDALPSLIQAVHQALSTLDQAPVALTPAVPVKKSVFNDHLVCLEDGRKVKMLKRHLRTAYGLTPEAYRAKWSLPPSYPMVCPDYAAKRSQLARRNGLGGKSATAAPAAPNVPGAKRRRKAA